MAKAMAECKDLLFKSPVIIKDTIKQQGRGCRIAKCRAVVVMVGYGGKS
jgi:hypothetical protein